MKIWQFWLNIVPSNLSVPVLLCLLTLVTNGEAIKCFVCDSSDNPSCADIKSNSSIVAEECTLSKMKSLNTWLFELNQFAYFENGSKKTPLMNCQKVVARDPNTNELVTARFCQLNSGESDSCQILKNKLSFPRQEDQYSKRNNRRNGRKDDGGNEEEEEKEEFHCSTCEKDGCNGSERLKLAGSSSSSIGLLVVAMTLIMQRTQHWWNQH